MKRLNEIFSTIFEIPIEKVTQELSMDNTPEWNSLTHIELLYELEKAYKIRLDSHESINMINYEIVKDILAKKSSIFES